MTYSGTIKKSFVILMADDDADDRLLTEEAIAETYPKNHLHFVEDGEQLLDFLYQRGEFEGVEEKPDLILLDLNMPRKDGREALRQIKADANLRHIPVVVLTTSQAHEDILRMYNLGVNSYITKPVSFERLVDVMRMLGLYWFETVKLPSERPE